MSVALGLMRASRDQLAELRRAFAEETTLVEASLEQARGHVIRESV